MCNMDNKMINERNIRLTQKLEQWIVCHKPQVLHSIPTFVRTIFPGVWEVSVMRHGGQASDEIEDDLYQYNVE